MPVLPTTEVRTWRNHHGDNRILLCDSRINSRTCSGVLRICNVYKKRLKGSAVPVDDPFPVFLRTKSLIYCLQSNCTYATPSSD